MLTLSFVTMFCALAHCLWEACQAGMYRYSSMHLQETREGYILEGQSDIADKRTAAEKRYDEMIAKREKDRVSKVASKSHRERVNEFNAYLQNLSEHHDIPKVGPG